MKANKSINHIESFYNEKFDSFKRVFGDSIQVFQLKADDYSLNRQFELLDIQDNDVIVDAGCGLCKTAIFISERKKSMIYGFNITAKQVEYAQNEINRKGLNNQIKLYNADFNNIDSYFKEDSFNKIYFIESLNHCERQIKEDLLKKVFKLMRKGGILFIQDFFHSPVHNLMTKAKSLLVLNKIKRETHYYIEDLNDFLKMAVETGFKIKFLNRMEVTGQHLKEVSNKGDFDSNKIKMKKLSFIPLEPYEIILIK